MKYIIVKRKFRRNERKKWFITIDSIL